MALQVYGCALFLSGLLGFHTALPFSLPSESVLLCFAQPVPCLLLSIWLLGNKMIFTCTLLACLLVSRQYSSPLSVPDFLVSNSNSYHACTF